MQYDCTKEFKKLLGSSQFYSYESFHSNLQELQKATQTYYRATCSTCFPSETVERRLLFYKYVRFNCELHKASIAKYGFTVYSEEGCPAFFTIGSKNSQLSVVKSYMVHNHMGYSSNEIIDPLPEPPIHCHDESSASVDCTDIFKEIFKDKLFSSYAELQAKMDEFQLITGSLYGKRNTKRFPIESPHSGTLVYKSFVYECYHYGTRSCATSIQRIRRSAKIGCRSRIHVSCYRNKLKIVRYDVRHNHDVAPEHAKAYPRNRRLTSFQLAVVANMMQTTHDIHSVRDFIENTFNTPCTLSDVRNIKSKLRASSAQMPGSFKKENEFIYEDEGDLEAETHTLGMEDFQPPPPQSSELGNETLVTQLGSTLEHIQELVLASPCQEVFESRMRCLSHLIEVWQMGKEATGVIQPPFATREKENVIKEITVSHRPTTSSLARFVHLGSVVAKSMPREVRIVGDGEDQMCFQQEPSSLDDRV